MKEYEISVFCPGHRTLFMYFVVDVAKESDEMPF